MAQASAVASTLPAGSVPPVSELKPGTHILKIIKNVPDGGREGPYKELEELYNAQFDFPEDGPAVLKEGVGVKGKDGKMREKTRLELYNENLANGKPFMSDDQLPTEFGERYYVHLEYPDGSVKEHQVKKLEELAPKITSQIRGRFGVTAVKFVTTPPTLDEGEVIEIEV